MSAGEITITGASSSEPAGERVFGPFQIQGTQVIGETLSQPLAAGDNAFAIPAAATAALIIPPENDTGTLKIRTSANNADAGLPISAVNPMVYPLPSPAPATLIITTSGALTAPLTVAFI